MEWQYTLLWIYFLALGLRSSRPGMYYIFIERTSFHFCTSCFHFISHFSSFLTREAELYSLSDTLKVHVSRDYNESFNGFPKVVSRLNEKNKIPFISLYVAGNVTMSGTVPTAHIAPATQRHSYATIYQGLFKNKKDFSIWAFLTQNRVQWGSDGVYGKCTSREKFGSPCVFLHGRWSPRSRDLGARSSSTFSIRHPIAFLPLSPRVPASPRQESTPLSSFPPTHPPLAPVRLQRRGSSRRAALDQPSIHRAFKLVCHFWPPPISLCVDHGLLLCCALRLWTLAGVSKNIKTARKGRESEERKGRVRDPESERGREGKGRERERRLCPPPALRWT